MNSLKNQGSSPLQIIHAVRSSAFAGVEHYVATTCAALAARGHDIIVISNDPAPMQSELKGAAVRVVGAGTTLGMAKALHREGRNADIVHAHMTAAEGAAVLARAFARGPRRRPLVVTRHFPYPRGSSLLGRLSAPAITRAVTVQLATSRFVAEALDEPTDVLLTGVADSPRVDPWPQVVLVAQRLEMEKHTDDALAAWNASGLSQKGWEMWIAGDGARRTTLELSAARAGAEIQFLGERDVGELRSSCGIFLATTPAEAFGLSVAESMAAGLPVVAAGAGGHLETVGAVRPDLLYPPGDSAACAKVLRRLAGDVELRRTAGRELRAFQQRTLSLDRHVDQIVAVYRRVLQNVSP